MYKNNFFNKLPEQKIVAPSPNQNEISDFYKKLSKQDEVIIDYTDLSLTDYDLECIENSFKKNPCALYLGPEKLPEKILEKLCPIITSSKSLTELELPRDADYSLNIKKLLKKMDEHVEKNKEYVKENRERGLRSVI